MNKLVLNPIFLSASVPDREPYSKNSDPILIREAILALVSVSIRKRELVFGGHPAISPLVENASRSLNAQDNVWIYQSRWFERMIPDEARKFKNLIWTDSGSSRDSSLQIMRELMIKSKSFSAAIFIGGMEGIFEEFKIFKQLHPTKPIFPIASTMGASLQLFESNEGPQDEELRYTLKNTSKYRSLFRSLLKSI